MKIQDFSQTNDYFYTMNTYLNNMIYVDYIVPEFSRSLRLEVISIYGKINRIPLSVFRGGV